MPPDSIIALIDKELQRLQQARALLTGVAQVAAKLPRKKQEKAARQAEPAPAAAAASSEAESVAVRYLPPRRAAGAPRRSVGRPRKAASPSSPGALGGTVPAGPIIVSAGQVQQRQKEAAKTAELNTGQNAASESLSAELLTQRWLRSSTA